MAADYGGAIDYLDGGFDMPTFEAGGFNERNMPPVGGGDMNMEGAGQDPFAYTMGSLLTPWTGKFQAPGPTGNGYYQGTGGYSPMAPFQYDDFKYDGFKQPTAFTGYSPFNAPTPFKGGRFDAGEDFASPVGDYAAPRLNVAWQKDPNNYTVEDFVPPTSIDDEEGYKFRRSEGEGAIQRSAARRGTLLNGNTLRALQEYNSGLASQEYGAAYGRRKGEYDTRMGLLMGAFDRNAAAGLTENTLKYDRAASEYDRRFTNRFNVDQANYGRDFTEDQANFRNSFDVYNANFTNDLNSWRSNADVALQGGRLGYDIASGGWDRNYGKAQNAYQMMVQQAETAAQIASAEAAAAAGGRQWADETAWNRAIQQYGLEYGAFTENQDRQYNKLMGVANLGQNSANALTGAGANFAGNQGNLYTNQGNANASAGIAGSNAYTQAASNTGNNAFTLAAMGITAGRKP